jgi:tRNA-Thr(GGU) m(6)t(6)A37 methyltransferase TsaA
MSEIKEIIFKPIGIIHTPFKEPKETPNQPHRGKGIKGEIEIFPGYEEALSDLDGFSHITLLYFFHLSEGFQLKVIPHRNNVLRGLFATRAPHRPNQIGLSVVRLIKIEKTMLFIEDIDMLDGTPLLDIKPYVAGFVDDSDHRLGWPEKKSRRVSDKGPDDRIVDDE